MTSKDGDLAEAEPSTHVKEARRKVKAFEWVVYWGCQRRPKEVVSLGPFGNHWTSALPKEGHLTALAAGQGAR